jgi:hypothetical protein
VHSGDDVVVAGHAPLRPKTGRLPPSPPPLAPDDHHGPRMGRACFGQAKRQPDVSEPRRSHLLRSGSEGRVAETPAFVAPALERAGWLSRGDGATLRPQAGGQILPGGCRARATCSRSDLRSWGVRSCSPRCGRPPGASFSRGSATDRAGAPWTSAAERWAGLESFARGPPRRGRSSAPT